MLTLGVTEHTQWLINLVWKQVLIINSDLAVVVVVAFLVLENINKMTDEKNNNSWCCPRCENGWGWLKKSVLGSRKNWS
jgi:hypothetical protein